MFPQSQILSNIYLDLVMADSITGICVNPYNIENKYSYTYTHENNVKLIIYKGFYKIRKSRIQRWKQFTRRDIE